MKKTSEKTLKKRKMIKTSGKTLKKWKNEMSSLRRNARKGAPSHKNRFYGVLTRRIENKLTSNHSRMAAEKFFNAMQTLSLVWDVFEG